MRYELRCAIHNIEFAFGALPKGVEAAFLDCPLCAVEKLGKLRGELSVAIEHRNLLLQAIELKLTVPVVRKDQG